MAKKLKMMVVDLARGCVISVDGPMADVVVRSSTCLHPIELAPKSGGNLVDSPRVAKVAIETWGLWLS